MKRIVVGIPKALYYYYYNDLWQAFFKYLNIDTIESIDTNKNIIDIGCNHANDEMCLSLKIYLGHISYLEGKCDYILVPRIDNYGITNQTCTNFLATYDIVKNKFSHKILNYNINYRNNETEKKAFIKIASELGIEKMKALAAYKYAVIENNIIKKQKIRNNKSNLNSDKTKVLIVGHPYNLYDKYIGSPIINILKKQNIEIIYSDLFESDLTNRLGLEISKTLYWKYSKEMLGSIVLTKNQIAGVIFLSAFPCGLDSLANELAFRKINIPYLNIIVDENNSLAGIETRIESFIDIITGRIKI